MTHRFRTIAKAGSTQRGYGTEHVKARKAAAAKHRPLDPCVRCGQPLGPMGRWLHYDHNHERTGYLGFAHAACNRKAGARIGNRRQARQGLPRTYRPRITPLDFGIRDEPEQGTCPVCDATFNYSYADQKTCSRACGWIYRTGKGPRCPVRYANCKTCAEPFVQHRQATYCSDTCRAEGARQWSAERHARRGTTLERTCKQCDTTFTYVSTTKPPAYCSDPCRNERNRTYTRARVRAHRVRMRAQQAA